MDSENAQVATNDRSRQKRPKKKKNSRFLRNAKGFAKQGIYGRGTHIEDDQYNYFINILDAMKNGFDDVEEKVNMANNVFEQTAEKEIHLASNQIVCKVLETLIGYVTAENLERFFNKFAESFRPICSDRFASHVLQKMVEIAFLRAVGKESLQSSEDAVDEPSAKRSKVENLSEELYNLETEFTEEHRSNCRSFVERIGKFLLNNLEDFVWDSCASHIMRTCILSLAGIHVTKVAFAKGGAEIAKNRKLYNVPDQWIEVMKDFPERLQMWPQFGDFPYDEHSSALLGIICIALNVVDKKMLNKFGKKMLMESFLQVSSEQEKTTNDENVEKEEAVKETPDDLVNLPKVFESQSSVILLETLLSVAAPKLLSKINAMLFTGRIAKLSTQALTNFAVQKLIANMQSKEEFEAVFVELSDHIEELLKVGHTGLVFSLSDACLRLGTKQTQLIVALQTALHVGGKENAKSLFKCLINLKPFEFIQGDKKSSFVHLHGSLVVQNILNFNKPIFLVNCILETSPDVLLSIFNTPNGSHIVDAFTQSKFIGEKSREKLIRLLEGFYVDMAITKFGSRVIERFFDSAHDGQKTRIVKELSEKVNMLKSTQFGNLIYNKFRIQTYMLSAEQWRTNINQKENKALDLFQDIIN